MSDFKIGFIGVGTMGEPMCINILKGGYSVWVYDIKKTQVDKLVEKGGIPCNTIQEIANNCNVIISMVPTSEDVKEVVNDLLPHLKPNTIYVDMSTISPKVSKELSEKVKESGNVMLDVPVVKSQPAAVSGNLGIYVGGDEEVYKKIRPILECMGKDEEIIYYGSNGSGLAMKMCHNMVVGEIQNGVNEMLIMAEAAGLKYDAVVQGIAAGGGQCFYMDAKARSIKDEDFSPKFSYRNMHKDMHLITEFADDLGLNLQGAKRVLEIYDKGIDDHGSEDFSATIKTLKKMVKKK
jgi:3-hydroxyisobutyrate dehydrogenase